MTRQDDLHALYRAAVLDHSRRPRNFRRIESAGHKATGHNPLCGDKITVYLELDEDRRVRDVAFEATGCAISLASASMLTELVKSQPLAETKRLITATCAAFGNDSSHSLPGDLAALAGVRAYPSRVRCATLPWRTLEAALQGDAGAVSTE